MDTAIAKEHIGAARMEAVDRFIVVAIDNAIPAGGDVDQSGAVSAKELANYVQLTASNRLIEEGIYVGGGFGNTLSLATPLLGELNLSQQQEAKLIRQFQDHSAAIDQLTTDAIAKWYEEFRKATARRVDVSAISPD